MAIIDFSGLRVGGITIGRGEEVFLGTLEIDEDSIQISRSRIYAKVDFYDNGQVYKADLTLLGQFDTRSDSALNRSIINDVVMGSRSNGGLSIRDINLRVSEFSDPFAFQRKLLRSHDKITGTNYDDVIDGLSGNDTIRGLKGNDKITGGTGVNQLYGGAGKDTFFLSKGSGHSKILDFTRFDKAVIKGDASSLSLSNRGGDAYIYSNSDLLGIISGKADFVGLQGNVVTMA